MTNRFTRDPARVGQSVLRTVVFGFASLVLSFPIALQAQTILQNRGADQRVDYSSLTKFGPWDDRNYGLTLEDLALLAPNEAELPDRIPAFYRVIMRENMPWLRNSGPAQYPRSATQLFRRLYGGLMINGAISGPPPGIADRSATLDGELTLNQITNRNEVTIEINPSNSMQAIAGANSTFGQEMYYSTDGGETWTVQGVFADSCCDPTVAWSSNGTVAYAGTLGNGGMAGFEVSMFRSIDGGQTWTNRIDIGAGTDKEFLHVDLSPTSPYQDNIYVTYHVGNVMQFTRSTDLGMSYSTPLAFAGDPPGIGSDITTDSAGNIYCFYGAFNVPSIAMLRSTDGGATFASATTVAATTASFSYPIPSMETREAWTYAACDADRSGGPFDGRVYVAWTDLTAAESGTAANNHTIIRVARSDDGGTTWNISSPHSLADSLTVDRYNQWITVGQNDGRVHVVYYDTRNSVNRTGVDFYYSCSIDGGVTWETPLRLSGVTSPNMAGGQEWGDYNGISAVGGKLLSTWTDNRALPNDSAGDAYLARLTGAPSGGTWVDFNYAGAEDGTQAMPFNTFAEGIAAVDLGGFLNFKPGTSSETPTVSNAMTLQAVGGVARIGVAP